MLEPKAIRNFQQRFTGRVIVPGDRDYEAGRRVHNQAIDRRPALIAMCAMTDDVRRAVEFARKNNLVAAIRSGGHSQVGHSVCQDGIVIDLSAMKRVTVDAITASARAQTGLRAGDLDHFTQAFGLATVLGQCPSVGIGGLTTGGGFGWLTGRYGLTCDNLISARVLTADSREVTARQDENEDLLWALKGGGGNFGVALEFEYRLHRVSQVVGGMLSYPLSEARSGFEFMREFLARAPDELTASFGIRLVGNRSVFAIALCWCGDPNAGQALLAQLRTFAAAEGGSIEALSYLEMQSVMGESPGGSCGHTRGGFMRTLPDAAIDAIIEYAGRNPSAAKLFWLDHYHGAMCRIAQEASAFAVREPGYGFLVYSEWRDPREAPQQVRWVDGAIEAMRPFSAEVCYVANLGDEPPDRIRACYGPNYARLAALKKNYDPDNFFRLNQNIPPATL
jgi:FAD/FMN-containing dehydrogenase